MSVRSLLWTASSLAAGLCLMASGCLGSQSASESSGTEASRPSSSGADSSVAGSPPPETAHVRAAFVSCASDQAPVACRIRIDEVLGYGSATPPIGIGERKIQIPSSALTSRDTLTGLLSGPPRRLVLHHVDPQLDLESNRKKAAPRWRLVSIETEQLDE